MGFPYELYRQWRAKNELIFTAFLTQQGEMIGFTDVFPIKTAVGRKLVCGDLSEDELTIDDISGLDRGKSAEYIYIASIVCCVRNTLAPTAVLAATIQYVRDLYPPQPDRFYIAIGSTQDGCRILQRLGFDKVISATIGRRGRQYSSFAARILLRIRALRLIDPPC